MNKLLKNEKGLEKHKAFQKAIFLDRDGTINIDHEYVHKVENFEFIPGIFEALRKAQDSKKYMLIVVTNQSGIGRGKYTIEDFKKVERYMLDSLKKEGIRIDKVYFCPHNFDEGCECRKPKIKFLLDAKREFDIDLNKSYMIGDKTTDIKFGKDGGCKTILVLTGKKGEDSSFEVKPDFIAKDLNNAIDIILEDKK
jgi:D-glycero-D-manno-heptose 1,7-bisphosphate phosphatase